MAFRWRADDGPLLVVFRYPHQLKKQQIKPKHQSSAPSDKTFSRSAHAPSHCTSPLTKINRAVKKILLSKNGQVFKWSQCRFLHPYHVYGLDVTNSIQMEFPTFKLSTGSVYFCLKDFWMVVFFIII